MTTASVTPYHSFEHWPILFVTKEDHKDYDFLGSQVKGEGHRFIWWPWLVNGHDGQFLEYQDETKTET